MWGYVYELNGAVLQDLHLTDEQANLVREFDWVVYESILELVYGKPQNASKYSGYESEPYLAFMKKSHNKSFLQGETKVKRLVEFITKE